MNTIQKYLEILDEEFRKYSNEYFGECSEEEKLIILYAYYHYFGADSSKLDEIVRGIVVENGATDKVAGIYVDQDSDNLDLDFIIIWNSEKEEFNMPAVIKDIKDTERYICENNYSKALYRKKIKELLSEDEYEITKSRKLKIVLLTDFSPKTTASRKSLLNTFNAIKPENENVAYNIVFGFDIEHEVLEVENPREYVEDAFLILDKPDNYLVYGDERSMIVNISAKSLKELYEAYSYRGLFAQNLRYYVKNAKVDENIIFSIQEKAENFWYYNNGIIIVCDSFELKGEKVQIKNFSIINGGQTTKLIGETDFDNNFFVQCKIVKNKYSDEEERLDFIADVAEASNTQKPIKEKDLIANKTEQRLLKKQLAEIGVYCQIKRGEKVNKKLYPNPWQNTTNEELGQFLLSFTYQKPGTARSNKASICGNKERYSLIYGKKYNSYFLADLLKIKAYYKLWMTQVKKMDDGEDTYKVGLVNNGMHYMTSIIGAICKYYYHEDYAVKIESSIMSEQKMEIISQHDIDHRIFKDLKDEKNAFFDLFEYCYSRFYRTGYEFLKTFKERYNNYSNFTKVNSNYSTYVFKQITMEFRNGIPQEEYEFFRDIFYAATEDEIKHDNDLLEKYVNVVFVDANAESNVPEEKVAEIKEALIDYRTKTFKLKRIKAYEVFKNVSADRIAKFAPETVEELTGLRCLDEAQIKSYGEDIVRIVKNIMHS